MNSNLIIDSPASPATSLPVAVISTRRFDFKVWVISFFLQLSHRLGAISLLATLATWAMLYLMKDIRIVLAVAAGTAEAGICFALLARQMTSSNWLARREANGVAIFNLSLFVLAIYLMLFTGLDSIRAAAGAFFTPTLPPQVENHW